MIALDQTSLVSKKFVWGWLRLFLSFVQTTCSVAAIIFIIAAGVQRIGLILFGIATAATLASRRLYAGKPQPDLGQNHCSKEPNT